MGLLWDLVQQYQLSDLASDQEKRSSAHGQDVGELRAELRRTQLAVAHLIDLLELRFNDDLDGDGRVGGTAERQFPGYKDSCPQCEFRFKWNGTNCEHCGYSAETENAG